MKKAMITIFSIIALVTGCGQAPVLQQEEIAPAPVPSLQESAQDILFLVDSGMDSVYLTNARQFAQRVMEITDGQLTVEVRTSVGVGSHFAAGRAQIAFLDSEKDVNLAGRLGAVSMPFLYPNYQAFAMAANAESMLDLLGEQTLERIDAIPVGAFYQPSLHLVSTWQLTDLSQFEYAVVATVSQATQNGFLSLGAYVTREASAEERVNMLHTGQVQAAEFTLQELATFDWSGMDYYLTLTYHTLNPVWLMVNNTAYQELSSGQRAAIVEASAYLFADIDGYYILQEEGILEDLAAQEMLISTVFTDARNEIHGRLENVSEVQRYVLDLVGDLE